MAGFRLSLQERFEACFVCGYAWVCFAGDYVFEYALPCVDVGAYVVEGCTVDFDVQGWVGWSV